MEAHESLSVTPDESEIHNLLQGDLPAAGAGRRYLARCIDTLLVAFPALLCGAGAAQLGEQVLAPRGLGFFKLPLLLVGLAVIFPVEGLLQAWLGHTPGKALVGIRLRTLSGARLGVWEATKRSLGVWVYGRACGVPFVGLIALYAASRRLEQRGATVWDEGRFRVEVVRPGAMHQCFAAAVALTILFVVLAVTQ